ncbi:hypothetical protein C1646_787641, partial [Rhizophagus diaphanus]
MTLISKSRDGVMIMLDICHSFYRVNDIKANPNKYEIIRINDVEKKSITINNIEIAKINSTQGNRFLGIFFTYDNNRQKHINKIRDMIKGFVGIMSRKILTDKQVAKLWNVTLIPAIEYQLLGVVLTRKEADTLIVSLNILMKQKCGMAKNLPNSILYDKDLYGVKNIFNLQLECVSKNIMYMANGNIDLSTIFKIQMKLLQKKFWSSYCFAEIASSDKFSTKTYIGDALIILKENGFNVCNHEVRNDTYADHRIKGGNITIEELLGSSFSLHRTSLRNCGALFLEQLLEPYTDRLLKWSHFIRMNNLSPRFEPKWFKILKEK